MCSNDSEQHNISLETNGFGTLQLCVRWVWQLDHAVRTEQQQTVKDNTIQKPVGKTHMLQLLQDLRRNTGACTQSAVSSTSSEAIHAWAWQTDRFRQNNILILPLRQTSRTRPNIQVRCRCCVELRVLFELQE